MDPHTALLEPKTIVLLDPTAEDGESALSLLDPSDRHVALLVLLRGHGSDALHQFADAEEIDLAPAADIYLDQVAERIAQTDRVVECVVAQGPDPRVELQLLAATNDVGRILVPWSAEPIDGAALDTRASRRPTPPVRRTWPFRPKTPPTFAANALATELPASELRCLERNGTIVTLPSGSTILRRGEPGRQSVIVLDGQLQVHRDGKDVAILSPGAIAGEMSLLTGQVCNADVSTTRDCTVLAMDRRQFGTVLDACPVMERRVLRTAVERFAATD